MASSHNNGKKIGGLRGWIDDRLGVFTFVEQHLASYQAPRNLSYLWNFGSLAGLALVIMIITGLVLAMHYQTGADRAFASVQYIMREVNYGWLIRTMHATGASFFFMVVYIHMLRGLYYGSFKEPRELLWMIGVVTLLLMMMTAFMGYVLPWGQMGFWGATVITNLFSAIPVFGETIVEWLWGGYSVGGPTLTRFYALHFVLPFVIVAVIGLHLISLHRAKSNNPLGVEPKTPAETVSFHPYYTYKDYFGIGVFLIVYLTFVFFLPDIFIESDNFIEANPLVTPPHIVPEWYFLPFYAILRSIPDKLGGVVAMFSSVFLLFVLPWLDRHPVKSGRFRPWFRILFWILLADIILLGWCAMHPPTGIYVVLSRFATVYYFFFFLVALPWLSRYEPVARLPDSIMPMVKNTVKGRAQKGVKKENRKGPRKGTKKESGRG